MFERKINRFVVFGIDNSYYWSSDEEDYDDLDHQLDQIIRFCKNMLRNDMKYETKFSFLTFASIPRIVLSINNNLDQIKEVLSEIVSSEV